MIQAHILTCLSHSPSVHHSWEIPSRAKSDSHGLCPWTWADEHGGGKNHGALGAVSKLMTTNVLPSNPIPLVPPLGHAWEASFLPFPLSSVSLPSSQSVNDLSLISSEKLRTLHKVLPTSTSIKSSGTQVLCPASCYRGWTDEGVPLSRPHCLCRGSQPPPPTQVRTLTQLLTMVSPEAPPPRISCKTSHQGENVPYSLILLQPCFHFSLQRKSPWK